MSNNPLLPHIVPGKETERIVAFLKGIFVRTGKKRAVIGWSGGIDSTVSLFLLARTLPRENITVLHLPYRSSYMSEFGEIQKKLSLSSSNIIEQPISPFADIIADGTGAGNSASDRIRKGNIMARLRMIILFDWARKEDALVCGTENRSEELLGYYTRFGDAASDIEPIGHLYKTQVYQLAGYLDVPDNVVKKTPTADLWVGQSDEGEFGFTYGEADIVLYLYFEKKRKIEQISAEGYQNADKIIAYAKKNHFKREVPFRIK